MEIQYILLGTILLWLAILTYLFFRMRSTYTRLVGDSSKKTIMEMLDTISKKEHVTEKEIAVIQKEIAVINDRAKLHIQKIGFIRFNPFERVGGEQSLILALLNAKDNGIILNFLYTREGVRVFAKEVKNGKGVELELSEEEKNVVKKAA